MEELRLKAAKLQKDCIAAQEKTDQCKEQADALQAELTATASEQITAANDRVRAEAEQKRPCRTHSSRWTPCRLR